MRGAYILCDRCAYHSKTYSTAVGIIRLDSDNARQAHIQNLHENYGANRVYMVTMHGLLRLVTMLGSRVFFPLIIVDNPRVVSLLSGNFEVALVVFVVPSFEEVSIISGNHPAGKIFMRVSYSEYTIVFYLCCVYNAVHALRQLVAEVPAGSSRQQYIDTCGRAYFELSTGTMSQYTALAESVLDNHGNLYVVSYYLSCSCLFCY